MPLQYTGLHPEKWSKSGFLKVRKAVYRKDRMTKFSISGNNAEPEISIGIFDKQTNKK